ncbi:ribonuclease HII [Neoasaia chiangmaiensis NBRC 101099]|uniref:Ribonuclease HII n=1 Tax=Neoasaia chiangmaiensis TaxID=320497 RepID=A0A1U9KU69_9PROT|nr:ribonuclease HII [Neoasaia chiangmaiensis]AQS89335.1 ribonuclease HII [Neoasaia chiangmaiensis]GBR42194.1 ribonuclease HII [Neoasaia chiangmaiensis NBRC 101099]GEN14136.1 ribonuclease HII [Neoasaia chiangmaiensis]
MPDFTYETAHGAPDVPVAGMDEVGRGPLAGPVVAAAVIFRRIPSPELAALIDDSKRLTARRRELACDALLNSADVEVALGAASVAEIERINIGQACHLAMRRAVARLPTRPKTALVDGHRAPELPCDAVTIIGGDRLSLSIAAASIVAKVVRDRAMRRLAQRHDAYAWERNAGYGTAVHLAGLRDVGVTPHHRRGFAPVRHYLSCCAEAACS